MLTCVHEGSLAFEDPTGNSGVIQAGEVQCRTTLRGMQRSETNGSQTTWVHVYQFGLRVLAEGLQPTLETKRFSAADRRGALRLVASPDARGGSLLIQFDALLFSAILDPGKHVVHELSPGRGAWFHVVRGRISSNTEELFAGDGVGVRGERSVSLTAEDESEILLLDLRQSPADTFRGEQEGEFTSAQ
jgi:redox-sensitive bicupin YhaK (pirin superfamily)